MSDEHLQGKTALIVDDAAIIRIMLTKVFSKHGIDVVGQATTGEEAIRLYGIKKPDLVTMDITMPGLDGIATIRSIIADDPTARIIVVSALGQQSKMQKSLAAGARDYIVKPIKEDPLMATVRRVLQSP